MSQFFLHMHVCMQSMRQLTQTESGSTGNARTLPVTKDTLFIILMVDTYLRNILPIIRQNIALKDDSSHWHCKCSQKNIKWNV